MTETPIYIFIREPIILGSGTAAKYISVEEALTMISDLQEEVRKAELAERRVA